MKRLFFFLFISCFFVAKAGNYDNAKVSLLTVMPRSNAVYTVFGHTALRIADPSQGLDIVLNWGTFDFNRPNFLYHFIKGETDYFLSAASMLDFINAYRRGNSTVVEQEIAIPDSLKLLLINALDENLQPENIEYRYNYFFDNCTLRPRDLVEKYCGGELAYPEQNEELTFRRLVHGLTDAYPWLEFGIDFLIGSGADSLICGRSSQFLPERLMMAFDGATVLSGGGSRRPLVISKRTLLEASQPDGKNVGNKFENILQSPLFVGIILFLIVAVSIIWGLIRKKRLWWLSILFLITGLGGCLVAFVAFFSVHPCTFPNWNLLWIHPLQLLGFAGFMLKRRSPVFVRYHALNFAVLAVLLLAWHWIPQELNIACIPLIACLLISSAYYLKYYVKQKK
ncbi:MAG: DUF4105 domain-containing protein [Dysgonamonadaceae bacterium]|jgi:hypothetical protein|nr:DUF4105 domain-containing protein [Dysgonamonadaceae bacterium]